MSQSLYIQVRNGMHPGYGECSKCGGNWGWKKEVAHDTKDDGSRGIFLFCESCDKNVTPQERWEALDNWKADCIRQIGRYYKTDSSQKVLNEVKDILNTELIAFPRVRAN